MLAQPTTPFVSPNSKGCNLHRWSVNIISVLLKGYTCCLSYSAGCLPGQHWRIVQFLKCTPNFLETLVLGLCVFNVLGCWFCHNTCCWQSILCLNSLYFFPFKFLLDFREPACNGWCLGSNGGSLFVRILWERCSLHHQKIFPCAVLTEPTFNKAAPMSSCAWSANTPWWRMGIIADIWVMKHKKTWTSSWSN